jgi:large subunit ribosomal protein L16
MDTLLAQGQHSNLSFYAFTATPKPKTLRTFGICTHQDIDPTKCRYEAFHTYSMLQAIEEGFIKDVLLSYTPYSVSYEITKRITDDPEYEETPATKAVKAFHDNHQHVVDKKCAIIVEKFREVTLPSMKGKAKGNTTLHNGSWGIQALEAHWITNRQIEACRVAITRKMKRGGNVWITIFPDKPISKKPAETRMGKGKGAPEAWVAVVKPGRIMFEISGTDDETAREALRLGIHKLPIKCKIVHRESEDQD